MRCEELAREKEKETKEKCRVEAILEASARETFSEGLLRMKNSGRKGKFLLEVKKENHKMMEK